MKRSQEFWVSVASYVPHHALTDRYASVTHFKSRTINMRRPDAPRGVLNYPLMRVECVDMELSTRPHRTILLCVAVEVQPDELQRLC